MITVSVYEAGSAGQSPRQAQQLALSPAADVPSPPLTVGNDRWRLENLRAENPGRVGGLLVLDDETEMSGVHAQLQWTGARWRIRNLSTAYPLRIRPWGYTRPQTLPAATDHVETRTLRHPRLAISFEPGATSWLICEPAGDDTGLEVAPGWDEALATHLGTAPSWVRGFLATRPLLAADEPGWDGDDNGRAELRRASNPDALAKLRTCLTIRFAPYVCWPPTQAEPRPVDARTAWKTYADQLGSSESTPRMMLDKLLDDITANRNVISPGVPGFNHPDDFLTFAVDTYALRHADLLHAAA